MIIIPRQYTMDFLADHMDIPPAGPLLRYFAKKCCDPDTRAAALPYFQKVFEAMLDRRGDKNAILESLPVALSADAQLFNRFIEKVHEPVPSKTLGVLRKLLQTGHVRFEEVKQRYVPHVCQLIAPGC